MKTPKIRLPIANKPNVTHKDKSQYDRASNKQYLKKELEEIEELCEDDEDFIKEEIENYDKKGNSKA